MPHWEISIPLDDFWHDDALTIIEKRDRFVERVKASRWREITPYPDYFDQLLDEFADAETVGQFNDALSELYDQADTDRVWLQAR